MHTLALPRLGQTMEAGTIVTWHVQEGESFDVGDPLYEVETEKSELEVEAKLPGTVARVVVPEGEHIKVGTVLAVIADPGEDVGPEAIDAVLSEQRGEEPGTAPSPDPTAAERSDAAAAAPARKGRVRAMPRAKRLATELGVDLAEVEGSGSDGTITEADVRAAAPASVAVRERRPLRGIAKAQAEQMTRSWQVPQFSQDVQVDASNLRQRLRNLRAHGSAVTFTDLVIDAVVKAVEAVPAVNATLDEDAIVIYEAINVSVAVATDAGLVVPVLRDCQAIELEDRATALAGIAARARDGALSLEDSSGGTITVSNLGMAGVETGVPLLNAPQACIVFTGAIVDRPVVRDGQVEVRPVMHVVNAFDHRIVDGLTAARFTAALRENLETAS